LSFDHCKTCTQCSTGHPAFCSSFHPLNFGEPRRFEGSEGAKVSGRFFGQSSFSSITVASESSVVNLSGLVKDKEELKLFAPLGCGLQTGSGTVANLAGAGPSDSVAILGLGGVGLSAIMVRYLGTKMNEHANRARLPNCSAATLSLESTSWSRG
jgi:Zn-dependent alcohol dehydrogenase